MQFTVPMPPSLNNAYATSKSGHRYPVKSVKLFKAEAIAMIQAQAAAAGYSVPPDVRLELSLVFHFKTARRTDISNRIKIVEDALAEALAFDDARVDTITVVRAGVDPTHPRTVVSLTFKEGVE